MKVQPIAGEHVSLFAHGLPETKGSWRSLGNGRMKNDNPREGAWCDAVGWDARIAMRGKPMLTGALVTMDFYLPKSIGKKYQRDVDKLCRSILDAMTKIVYVDDEQVDHIVASKEIARRTTAGNRTLGVEIHVFPKLEVRASQLIAAWIAANPIVTHEPSVVR